MHRDTAKHLDYVYRSIRNIRLLTFLSFISVGLLFPIAAALGLVHARWRRQLLDDIDSGEITLDDEDFRPQGRHPSNADRVIYLRTHPCMAYLPLILAGLIVAILAPVLLWHEVDWSAFAPTASHAPPPADEAPAPAQALDDQKPRESDAATPPARPVVDPAPAPATSGPAAASVEKPAPVDPEPRFADALTFDGRDDYLEVASASALNLGADDFTVEAWVKLDRRQHSYPQIMSNRPRHGVGFCFGFWSNGRPYMQIQGDNLKPADSADLRDGRWHHVAAVRRGGRLAYFVDGHPVGDTAFSSRLSMSSPHPLWIGRDAGNTAQSALNGQLHDVRLWRVARTAQQIQHARLALPDTPDGLVARWAVSPVDAHAATSQYPARAGSAPGPDPHDPKTSSP